MQFEDQLAAAMRTSVETLTPPVADLVSGGLDRGRQRHRRRNQLSAAAVASFIALAGAGAGVLNHEIQDDSSSIASPEASCHSVVRTGVLPSWAREGFSESEPTAPHVLSSQGDFAAILFGTLNAPPRAGRNNKILWVSRVGGEGPLLVDAVRAGTTTHVRREVAGGPRPSIVDLPEPGCWHLTLRWGDHQDTIDLTYERP